MSLVSERLSIIKPSPTLVITQIASELKRKGVDVISFAAGEPDFDTPDNIKEAAIAGIRKGATKYTNVDGMPELKAAVRDKFKRENDLEYSLDEIIVSTGGKQVIYNMFMASLNQGDEVIIPVPYWVSYSDIILLSGGTPIFGNCDIEDNFKLTPDKLEKAITKSTKWLIINSPNNPTGAGYHKEELIAIADVLRKHPQIHVLSDDIYEHVAFDDFKFYTLPQIAPDLKDRVCVVNGVSKAYAMTGWRIGYAGGPKSLIKAMGIIQSQSTSNTSSVSQVAAIEALNGTQDFIPKNAIVFQQKRDLALSILGQDSRLRCYKPQGAFYLFIECKSFFGKKSLDGNLIKTSDDFAKFLLETANVAVVQGTAFGAEGYFRISYATSLENIEKGCNRILEACQKLL